MIITVECTHSTAKLWNVHIQWLFAVECVHSTLRPLNVHSTLGPLNLYIQQLSTFNTTYIYFFFPVLTGDTNSSLLEIQLIELAVKDNYIHACMIQLTNKLKGIIACIESGAMIMTIYSSVTLKIG